MITDYYIVQIIGQKRFKGNFKSAGLYQMIPDTAYNCTHFEDRHNVVGWSSKRLDNHADVKEIFNACINILLDNGYIVVADMCDVPVGSTYIGIVDTDAGMHFRKMYIFKPYKKRIFNN